MSIMNGDSLPSSIPKPGHGAGAPGPDTCIIHSRPGEEEAQIFGTGDTAGGRACAGASDDRQQPGCVLPVCQAVTRPLTKSFLACVALPYVPTWGSRRSRARVVFGWTSAHGSPNLTHLSFFPSPSESFTFVPLAWLHTFDYFQLYLDKCP